MQDTITRVRMLHNAASGYHARRRCPCAHNASSDGKFHSRHRLVDGGKRDGMAECVRVDHIGMVVLDGIVPSDCC